jgi:PAS domain S-box-containing protein
MVEHKPEVTNRISSHQVFQDFNNTDMLNILAVDRQGVIVYANRGELQSTGYLADEYLGKMISEVYIDEKVDDNIRSGLLQLKELCNVEVLIKRKSGILRNAMVTTRNLQDDTGTTYTYFFVRDITAYKKNEDLLSYLNMAAEVLAGARNSEDALNKIAALIVPKFANWFTIDRLKEGKLELLKVAHADPEQVSFALEYRKKYPIDLNAETGTAQVLRTGQPSFASVVTKEMLDAVIKDPVQRKIVADLEINSGITVAMFSKDVITGVVTFISSIPGKYDETDLRFAQNFANHIGLALENARLNEEASAEIERRRLVEEELRKTQLQLNSALSSGLIGTWVRDLKKGIMYADESLCSLFDMEYSPEGIDPYMFISRIHPDDLEASELKRKQAMDGAGDYEAEYRILGKNGSIKWVFARGKTEFDSDGSASRFAGVVGDISERKKAEQALKESEERFRQLAETLPQKIFITDSESRILYLSPQWETFTGCTMDEIHTQTLAHFIHPDDLDENIKRWREAIESATDFQYEHRFRAKDGAYYWHLTRALALSDHQGKTIWIGSITDIDEQKKNEHKKDEFISIASHELKTPITSLRGYLQILSKMIGKEGNAAMSDLVSKTFRQAHKLSALISDLLDVSKMQAGKMNYNFVEFNFSEILDDAIIDAHNNFPSHQVKVKNNADILVYGDRYRLEQVLSNLLNNAAKYSPDANEIVLAIATSGDWLTVSVQDFGVGIPEEKGRFVFNRFFRVEDTSYKFTGLGIGLFISHEIIQRHKGKIWFSSKVGEGSTFTFTFPYKKSLQA